MPSCAVLPAGILYHDMYASDLVGTHVEMRSLEVRTPAVAFPPSLQPMHGFRIE